MLHMTGHVILNLICFASAYNESVSDLRVHDYNNTCLTYVSTLACNRLSLVLNIVMVLKPAYVFILYNNEFECMKKYKSICVKV